MTKIRNTSIPSLRTQLSEMERERDQALKEAEEYRKVLENIALGWTEGAQNEAKTILNKYKKEEIKS